MAGLREMNEKEERSFGELETLRSERGGEAVSEGERSFGDRETLRDGEKWGILEEWGGKRWKAGEEILGRYVVERELGQGGMGVVYECLDKVGGVKVAVKALPPELSHNSVEMEEVRENFELVYRLSHSNIASVKTLERDGNGEYFLVMEVAEGEPLRRWMRRRGRGQGSGGRGQGGGLPLAEVLPVLRQVAAALDYAHSKKVVHRDVKPGNVMIDASGEVKVLDFGLAAQIRTSLSRASQAYRGTSGTGPYMAPEQWLGKPQDGKADQYALAVMAYEMLAGRLPFENSELAVLKDAVLHGEADAIPGLPRGAMGALRRAMAKRKEERFGSCGEFVAALAGESGRRSARGKTLMGWVAVLALVGAGVWWWGKQTPVAETAGEPPAPPGETRLEAASPEEVAEAAAEEEARLAAERAAEEEARRLEEERVKAEREQALREAAEASRKAQEAERRAREAEEAQKAADAARQKSEEEAARHQREWEERLAKLEQQVNRPEQAIPNQMQVYLLGEVPNPGAVAIASGPEATVTRVILAQGGATEYEYPKQVKVYCNAPDGSRKMLEVNTEQILARGTFEDDVPLRDGYVIVVPEKTLWKTMPFQKTVSEGQEEEGRKEAMTGDLGWTVAESMTEDATRVGLRQQYRDSKHSLEVMKNSGIYGEKHPDILRLQAAIDEMERQMGVAAEEGKAGLRSDDKGAKRQWEVLPEDGRMQPKGGTEAQDGAMGRAMINVSNAKDTRMLDGNIGYVRVVQFGEETGKDLRVELEKLQEEGAKGLVLDLRGNPGGLLSAAVEVAQYFLNRGDLIVFKRGRSGDLIQSFRARSTWTFPKVPMAVLINGASASTSEIVAGALQDNKRAVLVGEKSAGDGEARSAFRQEDGTLVWKTAGYYYRPNDQMIHGQGIEPDVVVPVGSETWLKLMLARGCGAESTSEEIAEGEVVSDAQLERACDILKDMMRGG